MLRLGIHIRRGYSRSKGAKGKPKPLAGGRGAGGLRMRMHRQSVACDVSITHLGGGIDDECTGTEKINSL